MRIRSLITSFFFFAALTVVGQPASMLAGNKVDSNVYKATRAKADSLENVRSRMQKNVTAIKKQNEDDALRIGRLRDSINEITSLIKRGVKARDSIAILQKDISKYRTLNTKLKGEVQSLQNEVSILQNELDKVLRDVHKRDSLQNSITDLNSENQKIQTEISNIKKERSNIKVDTNALAKVYGRNVLLNNYLFGNGFSTAEKYLDDPEFKLDKIAPLMSSFYCGEATADGNPQYEKVKQRWQRYTKANSFLEKAKQVFVSGYDPTGIRQLLNDNIGLEKEPMFNDDQRGLLEFYMSNLQDYCNSINSVAASIAKAEALTIGKKKNDAKTLLESTMKQYDAAVFLFIRGELMRLIQKISNNETSLVADSSIKQVVCDK